MVVDDGNEWWWSIAEERLLMDGQQCWFDSWWSSLMVVRFSWVPSHLKLLTIMFCPQHVRLHLIIEDYYFKNSPTEAMWHSCYEVTVQCVTVRFVFSELVMSCVLSDPKGDCKASVNPFTLSILSSKWLRKNGSELATRKVLKDKVPRDPLIPDLLGRPYRLSYACDILALILS